VQRGRGIFEKNSEEVQKRLYQGRSPIIKKHKEPRITFFFF